MNGFGSALAEYFTKRIATIVATFGLEVCVVALCVVLGLWIYDGNQPKKVNNTKQEVDSLAINGDTTRNLYILEDTSTGMVWIGVPGINRIKK